MLLGTKKTEETEIVFALVQKCENIAGVELEYHAGPSTGHCCGAALFECYGGTAPGDVNSFLGIVDLNNPPECDEKYDYVSISTEQARELTSEGDCCTLYVQLVCATPADTDLGFGPGQCHQGIAFLNATQNRDGELVTLFSGVAAESPVAIPLCNV